MTNPVTLFYRSPEQSTLVSDYMLEFCLAGCGGMQGSLSVSNACCDCGRAVCMCYAAIHIPKCGLPGDRSTSLPVRPVPSKRCEASGRSFARGANLVIHGRPYPVCPRLFVHRQGARERVLCPGSRDSIPSPGSPWVYCRVA